MPNQKNAARHRAGEKKMTVEELQVLITANTKDFNAKIDKANKRLGSLEQQATRTGAGVGKLFTGIKTTAAVAVYTEGSKRGQEADGRICGKMKPRRWVCRAY